MMSVRSLLLGIALLAAGTTASLAQGRDEAVAAPVLRANVNVTGDVVRIGDVIDNAGTAAQIAIYRAPDLGTTGSLATAQVLGVLRAHQVIGVDTRDLKAISVTRLARTLEGKIVTNDFNLNKVAQLRGVQVLNINELANALKPVVLPGEFMKVFILKEGKEYNQGVAYLDDGTMVVVDNARRMISRNIDVVVTSVLQTSAGRMIFGRYDTPAKA